MRVRRRVPVAAMGGALAMLALLLSPAAQAADGNALAAIGASVSWQGAALTGSYASQPSVCQAPFCEQTAVRVQVPAATWNAASGGLAVAIDWSAAGAQARNQELDLYLFDAGGSQLASSLAGGVTSQHVYLPSPAPGTYTVEVEAFDAAGLAYTGTAALVSEDMPQAGVDRGATMRFSPESIVDPQFTTGEPGLLLASAGTAYVDAPWHAESGTSFVWRSDDGARTFRQLSAAAAGVADPRRRPCSTSWGGGDTDLVADGSGQNLVLADLEEGQIATARSSDGGASWQCSPAGATAADDDRPWLVGAPTADGPGPGLDALMLYRTPSITGQFAGVTAADPTRIQVDATGDGGLTWTSRGSLAAAQVGVLGSAFRAADGGLYVAYSGIDDGVYVARSADQGASFAAPVRVSSRPSSPSTQFVSGAVDAAGTVYVAWVDANAYDVLLSVSADRGATWSPPRQVNLPGSTAVLPTVAAGRAGDVAVGWYATPQRVTPSSAPPGQRWYAYAARGLPGAGAAAAPLTVARLSDAAMHFGPICLLGPLCASGDHSLGDFFRIAIDADGAVVGVFDDGGRIAAAADNAMPAAYVVAVRQTGGRGMAVERPATPHPGTPLPAMPAALTFSAAPSARLDATGLHLDVDLAGAPPGGVATAADGPALSTGWLLLWHAGDHVEYAVVRSDAGGPLQAFGGTPPEPVGDTGAFSFLSYPAKVPLGLSVTGTRMTVTVPPATLAGTFDVSSGAELRDLQAFSFTGSLTAASDTSYGAAGQAADVPLLVVDSTAPGSVELGAAADAVPAAARQVVPRLPSLPDATAEPARAVGTACGVALLATIALVRRRRWRSGRAVDPARSG